MKHQWMAPGVLLCMGGILFSACSGSEEPEELPYSPYAVEDIVVGTGPATMMGNTMTAHYIVEVLGRDTVVNSYEDDNPVELTPGIEELIDGWETGLLGMQVGGIRKLTVPPELGFGETGNSNGTIPPNATVVSVIELLELDQSFQLEDLVVGSGDSPVRGSQLSVYYTGWLTDGTVFDSTRTGSPFSFTIGSSSVIQGWELGLRSMRVGGTRKLTIPPNLAYGTAGNPPAIPGNATVIFEVELLAIQ